MTNKNNVPVSIWVNITGAFSAIKFGNYNIEYIPKSVADKNEQVLRDKIKNIFKWCDSKFRLIKKLERRIHRQRLALRERWEIVRTQQAYRKTPLRSMWFDKSIALGKENNALRNKISELEHQNAGLRQKIRGKFTWDNIGL